MMSIIRIIIILVAIFAESRVLLRYKDKKLNTIQLILWTIIWIGLLTSSFFISNIARFAKHFGLYDVIEVAVILSVILLFYLCYRQTIMNHDLSVQITKLVREIALLKSNTKKSDNLSKSKNKKTK